MGWFDFDDWLWYHWLIVVVVFVCVAIVVHAMVKRTAWLQPTRNQAIEEETYECPEAKHPHFFCLLYTSPSPRDKRQSRMPSSA